jgi:hypothetical protein
MTLQGALDTAKGAVTRFGKAFVIYRLDAWPADAYGVIAEDRGLPPEARITATIRPDVMHVAGQGAFQF